MMNFKFNLQMFKGGGSSTTYNTYTPSPEERALLAQQLEYQEAFFPNVIKLNEVAGDVHSVDAHVNSLPLKDGPRSCRTARRRAGIGAARPSKRIYSMSSRRTIMWRSTASVMRRTRSSSAICAGSAWKLMRV